MCGVAGYWGEGDSRRGENLLRVMTRALAHRGPDGEGFYTDVNVGLGHRRLAIIDLSGGSQPMQDASARRIAVLNGEIYNYRDLRLQLESEGFAFRTHSDTEVILGAIDRWGFAAALSRLRGMFVFAVYDTVERSLVIARDHVGIKPLYLGRGVDGVTYFASEPKAILATGSISPRADAAAVADFFTFGETIAPRTAWASIEELEPGTWVRFDAAGETRGRFWAWEAAPEPIPESDAVDAAEAVLIGSLRAHMEADVPVAAFLSGGIDSSLLVALLRKHVVKDLRTFTVGFGEAGYDESHYARRVADAVGTTHRVIRVGSGEGTPELFRTVVEQYDQPFGDSSALPTWLICREMARHGKVVISGDGGDEMFGGYERYQLARTLDRASRLPLAPAALRVAAGALRLVSPSRARQLNKAAHLIQKPRRQMLTSLISYFEPDEMQQLLQPRVFDAAVSQAAPGSRFSDVVMNGTSDAAEALMNAEIKTILHGDYLRKVDVASMAHALEVRTPYLDREVFELARRLPMSLKVRRGSPKHVLRLLAKRHLPHDVIDRPKQGFGIPFDRWIGPEMKGWLRDLLVTPEARSRQWLRPEVANDLLSRFESGASGDLSRYQVYQRVFLLSSFELWLRRWEPVL